MDGLPILLDDIPPELLRQKSIIGGTEIYRGIGGPPGEDDYFNRACAEWLRTRIELFEIPTMPYVCIRFVTPGGGEGIVCYTNFRRTNIELTGAGEGYWLNRRTLYALFAHPFIALGCARITAFVEKPNMRSRRTVEKLGFIHEGTHREAIAGKTVLSYGMIRRECRWLKGYPT